MFDCRHCPDLEKRIDHLIEMAQSERQLLYASMDKERQAWAKERSELLTRIQAWSPNPEGESAPRESQPADEMETVDGTHTAEELLSLGLAQNPDGGFVDLRLNPPILYETVDECLEVRAYLAARGLPANTNPTLLEVSFGEVLKDSRKFKNGTNKEDEA